MDDERDELKMACKVEIFNEYFAPSRSAREGEVHSSEAYVGNSPLMAPRAEEPLPVKAAATMGEGSALAKVVDGLDPRFVAEWLSDVAKQHGYLLGPLTYIFCNDEKILEVNREFLQHDYYTDIITFDYTRGHLVRGDMFISLDTLATNAELVGASPVDELYRVIAHGLLHLCGINDKGPGEREIMEAAENKALELLRVEG